MLIKWNKQKAEIVLADKSSHVALASANANWQHEKARCLFSKRLEGYDYLSITEEGFMPVSMRPGTMIWTGGTSCQWMHNKD